MNNEELENDTLKNEEELETPETPEEENPEEKSIEAEKPEQSKELQSALAQKEHFREKYEKAQEELNKKLKTNVSVGQNPMEVVRLAKALEGYSEEEVEFITRNAPDNAIQSIVDASKDDWVKTAISARREKVVNESKTPEPSTKQDVSKKSLDKITSEDVSNMSLKEKEDYFIKIGMMKKTKQFGNR